MRRNIKAKALAALLLSLVCAFGVFAGATSAYAYNTGDDYPYKNSSAGSIDRWRFYARTCTSFTAWCLESRNGVDFSNYYLGVHWGNADNWDDAARSAGITVNSTPAIGAVAQNESTSSGHVAWVAAINGDKVTVEEYNYKAYSFTRRTAPKSEFKYIHIKDIAQDKTLESKGECEGVTSGVSYRLVSALDSNQALDVSGYPNSSGSTMQLYHDLDNTEQVFRIIYENGYYHLQDYDSYLWLNVEDGSTECGACVNVMEGDGSSAQDWVIESAGGGAYYLRAKVSGYYLDVCDADSSDGTQVRLWEGNSSTAQRWYLLPYYGDASKATRLYGNTALDTMQDAVQEGWSDGSCSSVVLATSDGYWDALSASGMAGKLGCPVLLTGKDSLSSQTESEISRLGASKVYIVGGESAVSESVADRLATLGIDTKRVSGGTAVDTSIAVLNWGLQNGGWGDTCVIATSSGYWDALAASPFAYCRACPILLANSSNLSLDTKTSDALASAGFGKALVCGGESALSGQVEGQLVAAGVPEAGIVRKGGATAVETSSSIAEWCTGSEGMTFANVGVATSGGYHDALVGAALCGRCSSPLVLTSSGNQSSITGLLAANKGGVQNAYVFGGPAAVSTATEVLLQSSLA